MLKEVLSEEMIQVNQSVASWREAIQCCAKPLLMHHKIEEAYVTSMIETVETLGPYMILLPEIAFFHGTPGATVNEICLSLTLFNETVVFEEWKGVKVKAAFAFGAKDKDSHMQLLSQLATLLQDESFIQLLRDGATKVEILKKLNDGGKK